MNQFPDTSLNDLTKVVSRYKEINAWPDTINFSEESWNHLQEIMIEAGQLKEKASYQKLIYEK